MTAAIQTRALLETILDSGIQNTNYFNGRILNAGDLQTDQEANRQQHEQLGLAVGAGVARGLWVELVAAGSGATAAVVSVGKGLAVNAAGQAVQLPIDVKVALTGVTTPQPPIAGQFADCTPPSATAVPVQGGFYILVVTPTSGYQGQAPMFGFTDVNAATGCGSRYAVEGVLFRLVAFDVTTLTRLSSATQTEIAQLMTQTDAASLSKLRNEIAHICFGTEETAGFLVNPFPPTMTNTLTSYQPSSYITYGAIDSLIAAGAGGAPGGLTTFDVPLALLYWTNQGVQFLDCWSVRRPVVRAPLSPSWPLPFSPRQRAEAEAAFFQFEEQLASIFASAASDAAIAALQASSYFRYLPAAALIPTNGSGARGFALQQFLSGVTYRQPFFIEGAVFHSVLDRSLAYAPIDLTNGELIWTYLVRENIQGIDNATGAPPQQYIMLASGHMPFDGDARFDLNHWDYANFS